MLFTEINLCPYCQPFFDKYAKNMEWRKDSLFNRVGKTGYTHEKNEIDLILHHTQKSTENEIKTWMQKPKT